jgi:AmmeMemoRadiSam system protein A
MIRQESGKKLLEIARKAIEEYLGLGKMYEPHVDEPDLQIDRGVFVTLKIGGRLRGCIGRIEAGGAPLWQVVRGMAVAAAFEDPRFEPLTRAESRKLEIEISILSEPTEIGDWRDIVLGTHGVIVKKGRQSGVFLPQVATETGWTLEEFLAELCEQKAGLDREAYKNDPDVWIFVFTVEHVG